MGGVVFCALRGVCVGVKFNRLRGGAHLRGRGIRGPRRSTSFMNEEQSFQGPHLQEQQPLKVYLQDGREADEGQSFEGVVQSSGRERDPDEQRLGLDFRVCGCSCGGGGGKLKASYTSSLRPHTLVAYGFIH